MLAAIASFSKPLSEKEGIRKSIRNHGFVQGFGVTDPSGLQRKSGRLLVLGSASVGGDASQELDRQVGEHHKRRSPAKWSARVAGHKWASRIGKFGSEGDVLQVEFDESEVDASELAASLRASKKFRYVEPDLLIQRHAVPGVEMRVFDRKGYIGPRASQGDATSVVIAFLDTGLDFNNPLFAGVVKPGKKILTEGAKSDLLDDSEMDYNGHGTQMAGLSLGVAGGFEESGKRNVRLMGVKVMNADGYGSLSDLVKGIQWASENGAQVLNISAGTPEKSDLLAAVVRSVIQKGIVVVASAGNTASQMREYPSAIPGVLSVGATNRHGQIAEFSNHGKDVELYAQGVELASVATGATGARNAWGNASGTSASAALVSGAIAAQATRGGTVQAAKSRILRDAVSAYGTDVQPEVIKVLNLASVEAANSRDSLVVSAYPTYKYIGLENQAAFELLVSNASANSVKNWELRVVFDGAKASKELVVQTGAIRPFGVARVDVGLATTDVCDTDCRIYATVQGDVGLEKHLLADVHVTSQPRAQVSIADVWVDASKADGSRSLRFTAYNRSPWDLAGARLEVDVRAGIGDGFHMLPTNPVEVKGGQDLRTQSSQSYTIALPDPLDTLDRLGTSVSMVADGYVIGRKRRDFQHLNSDRVRAFHNQATHQLQAEEAIRLLKMHGVTIADLENPQYLGNKGEYESDWSPKREDEYVTGSTYRVDVTGLSGRLSTNLTLHNGLNDVDCADFTFGYTNTPFDSHFWIVDISDDDGLGFEHHSALTKVRALLFGRASSSDSRWKYGAIDHYKNGYKNTAYWLLGQALHLLGDMSVPEHVDDENWHGVWGSAYENWMKSNSYKWTAIHAMNSGGVVNPYRADGKTGILPAVPIEGSSLRNVDPIRFLMYTTAQVANIFPWYSLGWNGGLYNGQSGNKLIGGELPHYEVYLAPLLASLPNHPQAPRDLSKNEVKDFCTLAGCTTQCQEVDVVSPMEEYRDCWGGGDGHVDRDNTDNDGNDDDGDLSVIASHSYVNGIRALAGLIYYFGIETGQIPKLKSNPAMSAIQQLLLD